MDYVSAWSDRDITASTDYEEGIFLRIANDIKPVWILGGNVLSILFTVDRSNSPLFAV
jgi:hypothetical protein